MALTNHQRLDFALRARAASDAGVAEMIEIQCLRIGDFARQGHVGAAAGDQVAIDRSSVGMAEASEVLEILHAEKGRRSDAARFEREQKINARRRETDRVLREIGRAARARRSA